MGHSLAPDPLHDRWMGLALAEARAAAEAGEVPVGAVVVRPDRSGTGDVGDTILAARHNERESSGDPTAHAEILALRDSAAALGTWRMQDCIMVVTLEPCPMCAGALWAARIGGVVQAAANEDAGALGTLYNLGADPRLNHQFPVRTGPGVQESAALLQSFFAGRRR